jgi:DNA-binding transcriptional LysR family regulator
MLLPSARSLIATAARAMEGIAGHPVMLGASSNAGIYMLQPYLKRISDREDGRGVRIDLVIDTNPAILGKLEAGEIDLAVTEWWDGRPGFVSRLWRRETLVVIVAPDHPWAARGEISVGELVATPLLGGERGTGTGTLLRRALGDDAAARLRVERNLGSTEAVKRAVRAGLGISLVAEASVIDELRSGHLRAVGVASVDLTKEFYVVTPLGLPAESRSAKVAEWLCAEE